MITRLRLKGRMLLIDNVVLISLLVSTTVMLVLCINFFVLVYELFLRNRVEAVISNYVPLADLFVALVLLSLSSAVRWLIKLGADRYFLRLTQKNGGTAQDVFYYFKPAEITQGLVFSMKLKLLYGVWLVISFFPAVLSFMLLSHCVERGVSFLVAVILTLGTVAFLLSGIFFYRNINASLFLVKYHFLAGDCITFRQMISDSQESMKKRKSLLFRLKFSFIGWFLLCVFIFPIGYVWGYYNQTLAVAAGEFMKG